MTQATIKRMDKALQRINDALLINQDSGNTEYYTPRYIIDAARRVMGSIDLDPASSVQANNGAVGASTIYTAEDDGLSKPWYGNVWMNHPFSRGESACTKNCRKSKCKKRGYCISKRISSNKDWIDMIHLSYMNGYIKQGCCITFASTSERWFQPLLLYPQCYISPRVNYIDPEGKKVSGCTKGSVVTYFGQNITRFANEFCTIGSITIPYRMVDSLRNVG